MVLLIGIVLGAVKDVWMESYEGYIFTAYNKAGGMWANQITNILKNKERAVYDEKYMIILMVLFTTNFFACQKEKEIEIT